MNITKDSPELTAYALGELDEITRKTIETAIATDPQLQQQIDEIRTLGNQLEQELVSETAPQLTEAQRIAAQTPAAKPRPALHLPPRNIRRPLLAAAAGIALILGIAQFWLPPEDTERDAQRIEVEEMRDALEDRIGQTASSSTQRGDLPTEPGRTVAERPAKQPAPAPTISATCHSRLHHPPSCWSTRLSSPIDLV